MAVAVELRRAFPRAYLVSQYTFQYCPICMIRRAVCVSTNRSPPPLTTRHVSRARVFSRDGLLRSGKIGSEIPTSLRDMYVSLSLSLSLSLLRPNYRYVILVLFSEVCRVFRYIALTFFKVPIFYTIEIERIGSWRRRAGFISDEADLPRRCARIDSFCVTSFVTVRLSTVERPS